MKPTDFDLRIIDIIRAYRLLARQKQANLARELNITQPEYSRIEKGERALTLGHLQKICDYLCVPVTHVIGLSQLTLSLDFRANSLRSLVVTASGLAPRYPLKPEFGAIECEYILMKVQQQVAADSRQEIFEVEPEQDISTGT